MGKITSIYLTDEEVAELKKFCDENQCTRYSALKSALRELLSKPIRNAEIAKEAEVVENSSQKHNDITRARSFQLLLRELKKLSSE